ncbi:hypothetical protein CKM354_000666900 [Cercospora kikuchii]|uniref:Uncharacterized protein n=1 Tax=Cercospora kikuchii TaxID=84275 RepID=A0A9P3FDJ2_9PEZI|nr:uncharacterized protein CKM354_000666900 [Cercospora kikuchii]GIZ43441.1 hypothetical protein CKM354_000666900 [Cercospora kikuchii]
MPEPEPVAAATTTMVEKLQAKFLSLSHAYTDGQGIERCAFLMFDILLDCRAIDKETFEGLRPTDIWALDTVCQDAIQMTGHAVQWALAPRRDPSAEHNLAKLRFRPGNASKLDPKYDQDPLALRLHVLRSDMCELMTMDSSSSELVDLAADVLRLCSGKATIAHFSNGQMLWLDAVSLPRDLNDTYLRYTLFDSALLTLICISRWYAAWFDSMTPASWAKRSVRLWAQDVPGTGAVTMLLPYRNQFRVTNLALSSRQIYQRQKLDHALRELLAMSFVAPAGAKIANPDSSKEADSRWYKRGRMVVNILKMAIEGRALQRDPQDEHFSTLLFDYAQKALDNMFIAAKIQFGLPANPTTPSIHVPSPRGPEPEYNDHSGRRQWLILKTLDSLHGTEPIMEIRQDMALSILQQVEGENLIVRMNGTGGSAALHAVQDKDEGWRTEMLRYAEFAIVALAQHLSARFDGREIKLMNKLVESRKRPWQTEDDGLGARRRSRKYPETVSYTDGAWKET